ncbi:class I SAM-dependent methyltransferase [Patescibacteria group bacterium]|nr:class I SAM-dependent methyltransferase [Patescibacteria group bacterium]
MEKFVYQQLHKLETSHWWYQGRETIIKAVLKKFLHNKSQLKILDIGCGGGSITKPLTSYGSVTGLDNNQDVVNLCNKQGERVVKGNATRLPFPDQSFNFIVALEVFEHVKDDTLAIKEAYRVLKRNGRLFLSVPAFPILWGNHDMAAHHYRRYTQHELLNKLKVCGFSVLKLTYMNFFLFLPIVVFRLFHKKIFKPRSMLDSAYFSNITWLNFLLAKILSLEAMFLPRLSLPFGVTLICVVQKK